MEGREEWGGVKVSTSGLFNSLDWFTISIPEINIIQPRFINAKNDSFR